MAVDNRKKNVQWMLHPNSNGTWNYEVLSAAILMDIRDELQTLNRLLACPNFIGIPRVLQAIRVNTRKPRPKKKAAKP